MITKHIRARTGMMRHPKTPVFRGTYLSFERIEDEPGVATAATDGKRLFVNLGWIENLTLEEQIGVLVHECYHKMLKHHLRFDALFLKAKNIYPRLTKAGALRVANISADIRINSDMIADGFKLPADGIFDPEGKYAGQSMERIFFQLLKEEEEGGGSGGKGPAWGTFGEMPGSGQDGGATADELRAEDRAISGIVAASIALGRKQGNLPGGLEELVKEGVVKPDWKDLLVDALQRAVGADDFSMSRISNPGRRNGFVLPGVIGYKVGNVVIGFDTSGSITNKEASLYIGQINALSRCVDPDEIKLIQCDAKVQHVSTLHEGETVTDFVIKGRGGTDFRPVFQWVQDNDYQPDVLVYLTDMEGRFPIEEPTYPVIWCATKDIIAPFGRTIKIT